MDYPLLKHPLQHQLKHFLMKGIILPMVMIATAVQNAVIQVKNDVDAALLLQQQQQNQYHVITIQAVGVEFDGKERRLNHRDHNRDRNRNLRILKDKTAMFTSDKDMVDGFVIAGHGYVKALTALLHEPLDSGDVTFGIQIIPKDGSSSTTTTTTWNGIHFDDTIAATSGHVVFDESTLGVTVSPGDVVKFIVTHNTDDKVEPKDNSVSLVAHIAQRFE